MNYFDFIKLICDPKYWFLWTDEHKLYMDEIKNEKQKQNKNNNNDNNDNNNKNKNEKNNNGKNKNKLKILEIMINECGKQISDRNDTMFHQIVINTRVDMLSYFIEWKLFKIPFLNQLMLTNNKQKQCAFELLLNSTPFHKNMKKMIIWDLKLKQKTAQNQCIINNPTFYNKLFQQNEATQQNMFEFAITQGLDSWLKLMFDTIQQNAGFFFVFFF